MEASLVQDAPQGGLGVRGGARRQRLDGAGGSAAEETRRRGAPVRVGRGEVVWELRGLTAELARGSVWAEELR